MSMRVATISAVAFFAMIGMPGVSAAPINSASSIVPATAGSLVDDIVYEVQEGRCYWLGRTRRYPVDMSKCAARGRGPAH